MYFYVRWSVEWRRGSEMVDRTEKYCNNWRGDGWDFGGSHRGIWICSGLF